MSHASQKELDFMEKPPELDAAKKIDIEDFYMAGEEVDEDSLLYEDRFRAAEHRELGNTWHEDSQYL